MKPITEKQFTQELLTDPKWFWNCRTQEQLDTFWKGQVDSTAQLENLMAIVQNNNRLFVQICSTIPTMDGWATLEKVCTFASLALAIKPNLCLEVGVFAGRSLIPVA